MQLRDLANNDLKYPPVCMRQIEEYQIYKPEVENEEDSMIGFTPDKGSFRKANPFENLNNENQSSFEMRHSI